MEEEKEVEKTTEVVTEAPTQHVVTTKKKIVKEPEIKTEHPQSVFEKKKKIFRSHQVIWYILAVIEVILVFRFILQLLGADPYSGFASLIYSLSIPFAVPFVGVVPPTTSGRSVVEWSTLIAMFVFWVIAYGIIYLYQFEKPVTPDEVEHTVDSTLS